MPEGKSSVGGSISDTSEFTNYNIMPLLRDCPPNCSASTSTSYIVYLTGHESLATQVTVR